MFSFRKRSVIARSAAPKECTLPPLRRQQLVRALRAVELIADGLSEPLTERAARLTVEYVEWVIGTGEESLVFSVKIFVAYWCFQLVEYSRLLRQSPNVPKLTKPLVESAWEAQTELFSKLGNVEVDMKWKDIVLMLHKQIAEVKEWDDDTVQEIEALIRTSLREPSPGGYQPIVAHIADEDIEDIEEEEEEGDQEDDNVIESNPVPRPIEKAAVRTNEELTEQSVVQPVEEITEHVFAQPSEKVTEQTTLDQNHTQSPQATDGVVDLTQTPEQSLEPQQVQDEAPSKIEATQSKPQVEPTTQLSAKSASSSPGEAVPSLPVDHPEMNHLIEEANELMIFLKETYGPEVIRIRHQQAIEELETKWRNSQERQTRGIMDILDLRLRFLVDEINELQNFSPLARQLEIQWTRAATMLESLTGGGNAEPRLDSIEMNLEVVKNAHTEIREQSEIKSRQAQVRISGLSTQIQTVEETLRKYIHDECEKLKEIHEEKIDNLHEGVVKMGTHVLKASNDAMLNVKKLQSRVDAGVKIAHDAKRDLEDFLATEQSKVLKETLDAAEKRMDTQELASMAAARRSDEDREWIRGIVAHLEQKLAKQTLDHAKMMEKKEMAFDAKLKELSNEIKSLKQSQEVRSSQGSDFTLSFPLATSTQAPSGQIQYTQPRQPVTASTRPPPRRIPLTRNGVPISRQTEQARARPAETVQLVGGLLSRARARAPKRGRGSQIPELRPKFDLKKIKLFK